ncbi:histidine kinase [Neobacillus sp. 3P2-tot-E-2]|uniref:sensor histidine kinase n=1 Tax=Neobacillus sp. 3P2-tot-E-2 TaxID=3132212 RepID=UPI00399FA629
MENKKYRQLYNSISFKIVFYIIIVLTPLISVLIYYNYQTHESLLKQVEDTHRNMLDSYMLQLDSQLKNSMTYSLDMALFHVDPKILVANSDETDIAFAKHRIFMNQTNRLLSNNLIDAFFLYVKGGDYYIIASQNSVSESELSALKGYVITRSKLGSSTASSPKSNWITTRIDKNNGLINMSYGNGDIIAGSYTNTDKLISKYNRKNLTKTKLIFISSDSFNNVIANQQKDHVLITSQSSVANVLLGETLSKAEIEKTLPIVQRYILLVSIIFALMLPVLILLMNMTVVNPLRKLTRSMARVRKGDLTHRMKLQKSSNELEMVNATFNEMMDTVQNLKISIYEEQIKVQKSQLRNLQSQLNPHFLINSLNMVNNLIQTGDLNTAKKLILNSVDFFRFRTKIDNDFVPLIEEINHISDYLEIQKVRYKNKFTYTLEVNRLIEDMLIPPMLIQNFVENSIKYAIEMTRVIHISIRVEYFEVEYYPFAKITITDNGIGYPAKLLEQLNSGMKITDSLGDHIGISNCVQRIKILYDGKGSWKFYNDGGAISELTLPALFDSMDT